MVTTMVLGLVIAVLIWRLFGWQVSFWTFVAGFIIAPALWAVLWPWFLVLGALPGYLASPFRREFKRAWKGLGCGRRLDDENLRAIWRHHALPGVTFYAWLKDEWMADWMSSEESAEAWLRRLEDAVEIGNVWHFWLTKPDSSAFRELRDAHIAGRVERFGGD